MDLVTHFRNIEEVKWLGWLRKRRAFLDFDLSFDLGRIFNVVLLGWRRKWIVHIYWLDRLQPALARFDERILGGWLSAELSDRFSWWKTRFKQMPFRAVTHNSRFLLHLLLWSFEGYLTEFLLIFHLFIAIRWNFFIRVFLFQYNLSRDFLHVMHLRRSVV